MKLTSKSRRGRLRAVLGTAIPLVVAISVLNALPFAFIRSIPGAHASALNNTSSTTSTVNGQSLFNSEAPTAVTAQGHIAIQGRGNPPNVRWSIPLTVTLRSQATGAITQLNPTTDSNGFFSITVATAGTYDWYAKNPQTLANGGTAMVAAGGTIDMGMLPSGDIDNNNCVSGSDMNSLRHAYGSSPGDPIWDPAADLDSDGTVGSSDYNLMRGNYGRCGAAPISTTGTPTAVATNTAIRTNTAVPTNTGVPATATRTSTPPPSTGLPWLKTMNGQIVRVDNNQRVELRGANVLHNEWVYPSMTFERSAIPYLANNWHANLITHGFASAPVVANDSQYLAVLDEYQQLAEQNGIYIIFAYYYPTINGDQPEKPDDDANAERALTLLAQRYATKSNVLLMLQAEPHSGVNRVTWSVLRPIYDHMVNAIRAVDTNRHLILASGDGWGRDISGAISNPVTADGERNIVYSSHPYDTQAGTNNWDYFLPVADAGKPVLVTEFGTGGQMAQSDTLALMNEMNNGTRHIGWTSWIFDTGGCPCLISSGSPSFAPTDPYGISVRDRILAEATNFRGGTGATNTPAAATSTPTRTNTAGAATRTNTPAPSTPTRTNTAVGATATRSNTPQPTATSVSGLPPIPAGFPSYFGYGLFNGNISDMHSGVPYNYRYQYLAGGVNTGGGWQTWGTNYAQNYVSASRSGGYIPGFVYYNILQSAPNYDEYSNLQNSSTMLSYYRDFKTLLQQSAGSGAVFINVEPDLDGVMMQHSSNTNDDAALQPAKVAATGMSELAGIPDNFRGYWQALAHLRDLYAPNVVLGQDLSIWGADYDLTIALRNNPSYNWQSHADRTARYHNSFGPGYQLNFFSPLDRDAAYYQATQGSDRWWHDSTQQPSFNTMAAWLGRINSATGKRALMWQVPNGNQVYRSENNTSGHYQDNRAEFFLNATTGRQHMSQWANYGVLGVMFGAGVGSQSHYFDSNGDGITNPAAINGNNLTATYADDDGGYIRLNVGSYYSGGTIALPR